MQLSHFDTHFERANFPVSVICDHIYFQQNIGSLFRICEAFGVNEIIFTGKDIPLNPRKINKTSRSTHLKVPYKIFEDSIELKHYLQENNFQIIALEITQNSQSLSSVKIPKNQKIALLLGSEINGISEILLQIAHQILHINMYGENSSMNVVQAASICLYEITNRIQNLK
ncbi:TrmH family RNA methyltransferase [Flavobacterium agrisoli]|uniref:TrmH family RNA methyltransferase n=1 Tax=Flavobacterium agrisoli TaxID=2793066 RepID=A0A934UIB8_9FLAO|nr:TrmH family RNA methyltransferase [Flavobacterium agrisoli]MBK0368444.1 TrmH family RNA methyltransferase [Flavobacterium agrisoli]